MIKTMEELFGVLALTRENIINKIGEIIEKIIGTKRNKKKNKIYYDPNFADLSSDDFDDFEDDNEQTRIINIIKSYFYFLFFGDI